MRRTSAQAGQRAVLCAGSTSAAALPELSVRHSLRFATCYLRPLLLCRLSRLGRFARRRLTGLAGVVGFLLRRRPGARGAAVLRRFRSILRGRTFALGRLFLVALVLRVPAQAGAALRFAM